MFRRVLALLLCSVMLVGSLPETSFAVESAETTETMSEEAETTETEETARAEGNTDASKKETEAQTEEKKETEVVTENEAVTETTKEDTVSETTEADAKTKTEDVAETTETEPATKATVEAEETAIVETEVTTKEETTEEETSEIATEEITAEEIENTAGEDAVLGNEYVTVSNVKVAYNSISFDYENKDYYDISYIYLNSPKNNKYIGYGSNGSVTIGGLNPSTEYEISFCDSSLKQKYYTFSEKTAELPYKVTYNVTSTKADTIDLSAEITAKEGAEYELPSRFELNYKCFDENGTLLDEGSRGNYEVDSLPVKITTAIDDDPAHIFGNTKYTVEMWINESYDHDFNTQTQFAKDSKEVTTPAPAISDVGVKIEPNPNESSTATYTLTTGSYTEPVSGMIFWRLKGTAGWWQDTAEFTTENGSATGSLFGLSLGSTYEYMINIAGFKKTGEFTNGEAKLKWDMSCDMGAIDAVVTFKLKEETKMEGAEYDVYASYKRRVTNVDWFELDQNGTRYTATYLKPNTEYDIRFDIYEYLLNGSTNVYTAFETVTTKASAVKTTISRTYIDAVSFDIQFDNSVRTENLYDEIEVFPYIKNQDGKYIPLETYDGYLCLGKNRYGDGIIYGLESNKTYEISFGQLYEEETGDETYFEYGAMTFKTAVDDRTFTLDTPEVGVSSFQITGTFKGSALPYRSTVLYLLCREKGSDKWKYASDYEIYADEDEEGGQSSEIKKTFRLSAYDELEAGKEYEYAVGMGTWDSSDINSLKSVKQGTVKLNADERSVEVTDTVSLLDGVVVRAKLLGNYIDHFNDAQMLYREKGKTDASWDDTGSFSFENGNRETYDIIRNYNGEALKSGTTYEYKLCMYGKLPEKEEDYVNLKGGEFTYTKPADDRALQVEVTPSRTSADFTITLTGSKACSNYIPIFYRKKGDTEWKTRIDSIYWGNSRSTVSDTISGLTADTEYEYIVGISNDNPSSVDDIVTGKKEGTFTTKDTRKLGTPVITTGYSYADFTVEVEGLSDNYGDSSYVTLYIKDEALQGASWIQKERTYVYGYNNTAKFSLSGLEQGKTYAYALVISDRYYDSVSPDSEAFGKLSADRKLVDKFSTKKSDYTLKIEEDSNSVFGREILNLTVESATFNEKNFAVELSVRENETNDYVTYRSLLINSADHTAEAVFTNLAENTKYDVTALLYAKVVKNGSISEELVATTQYSFTTKKAQAPTELKANVEELWLNSWNPYYNSYAMDIVRVTVPDGASKEVTWTSSNPSVVSVYEGYGGGFVYGEQAGEATVTATSVLSPSVKAEVKVHVANYGVVFTDTKTPSKYNSVYTTKNKNSTNIAYAKISDDGTTFKAVEATGVSDDPSIAYWDAQKQCIVSKNVGSTYIVLEADNYKTELAVTVYAESSDFDLKVSPTEKSYYDKYPALKKDAGKYQIASGLGKYYRLWAVNPEISEDDYDINDVLTFTSSDPSVLTVSDGYVKGLKKGTATVTVAYDTAKIKELAEYNSALKVLSEQTDLASKKKTVTFDVKPLYTQGLPTAHAITNIHKTLKDITTLGEGWTWRDPETPLYALPNSGNASYAFEAEYTGEDYYNYEGTVEVSISTINGVAVTNNDSSVISVGGTDSINLIVKPEIYGFADLTEGTDYTVAFPAVTGVTVTPDPNGWKVTASSKGKYTLKPEIKVGETVVATGSYAVTAVEGKLIDHIDVVPVTDNDNVTIKGSTIYFDTNAQVADFQLKATAYDRKGDVSADTKLAWTITDKKVADVNAKTSDREVTVNVKGDGHALIQVTAGDEAKASAQFKLEVRNRKPRVEGDKVTINTAYDYSTSAGRELSATQYGVVSVANVYGEDINSVQVVSADAEDGVGNFGGKISDKYKVSYYSSSEDVIEDEYEYAGEDYYVIAPVSADVSVGKDSVKLAVTTSSGFTYTYPLAVTVVNKQPKVSVKVSNTMNLFYLSDMGYLDVTLEKNKSKDTDFSIESIKWNNSSENGFRLTSKYGDGLEKTPNVKRFYIDGSAVKVSDGKVDPSVASSTVTIKLAGVREAYTELPVTVKYSYKKPKLTTSDYMTKKNVSTIIPSMRGGKLGCFYINADKTLLQYTSYDSVNARYYNEYRCGNDKVTADANGYYVSFTYSGEEKQFDIPLTIDSYDWREALTVTHKVKAVEPTAVLSNAKLTYNTNYDAQVYTKISLKDYPYAIYSTTSGNYSILSAVDVTGADVASQELLTSGKLQVTYDGSRYVVAKLNASKLDGTVPKGASFVLTPYYFDASTGESKALNTLALKLTFTNKPVSVKISGKGSLDLAVGDYENWLVNSIAVTPKFANLGSGYGICDYELTGEYSRYFALYNDYDSKGNFVNYIKISESGRGRLKAGQTYNLSITYTLKDNAGNRITVKSSNALKVKPVQKAPKLTVVGDNRILYTASPNLYRRCTIRTPYYNTKQAKDYCAIKDAYGFIDTNKDGKADIEVKLDPYDNESSEGYASLKIKLTDKDAIVADAKGKAYTIPVTVKLVGRDGISKDAVVKIKVRVKK